jgi:transcriptional repressor NrdR
MYCPFCKTSVKNTKVIDSREVSDGVRRRRQCEQCSLRFTTYERIATGSLMVTKRDQRREPFNKDKLIGSLQIACTKRPIASQVIDDTATKIEEKLYDFGKTEISSSEIGEIVIEHLKDVDDVAYIRFVSVYLRFEDVDSMAAEIKRLQDHKRREAERRQQLSLPIKP